MNLPAGQAWLSERSRAWAESLDVFAMAGRSAAAAATRSELRSGIANSMCGYFADWVIVDLSTRGHTSRSVASSRPESALVAALEQASADRCPPIASAMRRRTPVVQPAVVDRDELGVLADGRDVVTALQAGSYAIGPIGSDRAADGAITIVREEGRPPVSFVALAMLAHVGELIEGALTRIDTG